MSRASNIKAAAVATILLICTLVAMSYHSGQAATVSEDYQGGEWTHGSSGGMVWSQYEHPDHWHYVWVQGQELATSPCVAPGEIARVTTEAKTFGPNHYSAGFCDPA